MQFSWKYRLATKARSALFGLVCAATVCLYVLPFLMTHK
jgi:hypothetical protein